MIFSIIAHFILFGIPLILWQRYGIVEANYFLHGIYWFMAVVFTLNCLCSELSFKNIWLEKEETHGELMSKYQGFKSMALGGIVCSIIGVLCGFYFPAIIWGFSLVYTARKVDWVYKEYSKEMESEKLC